jgi:uncharacterized protein (TIGR02266 family)
LTGLKVTFRGNTLKDFALHYVGDLNPSGMFVRTRNPLPVGTKLRFDFRLEDDSPLFLGEGVVLWVAEENRELSLPAGMELRFDLLSAESESRFQWLQLEKRGVRVGTELPLSISTSSNPNPDLSGSGIHPVSPASPSQRDSSPFRSPEVAETIPDLDQVHEVAEYPYAEAQVSSERAHAAREPVPPGDNGSSNQASPAAHAVNGHGAPAAASPGATDPSTAPIEPRRPHRAGLGHRLLWSAAGMAAVALGLAATFGLRAIDRPPPSGEDKATPVTRAVHVFSDPVGADVYLDGRRFGTTPVDVPLAGHPHLTVGRPGFVSEEVRISNQDPRWAKQGNRMLLVLLVSLRRAPDGGPPTSAEVDPPEGKNLRQAPRGRPHPEIKGPVPRRKKAPRTPPSPWSPFKPGAPTADDGERGDPGPP